ncbi:uncharacterized protein [Solanum tuberosum]|uniref:uncharacterized protein n=1 Tax=Solanum tuberosum TaxID=4113 RepID=UPI00073A0E18|nr:PREDICTED: uncharacterized protein LOC107062674 [Solanum tuberosum]
MADSSSQRKPAPTPALFSFSGEQQNQQQQLKARIPVSSYCTARQGRFRGKALSFDLLKNIGSYQIHPGFELKGSRHEESPWQYNRQIDLIYLLYIIYSFIVL